MHRRTTVKDERKTPAKKKPAKPEIKDRWNDAVLYAAERVAMLTVLPQDDAEREASSFPADQCGSVMEDDGLTYRCNRALAHEGDHVAAADGNTIIARWPAVDPEHVAPIVGRVLERLTEHETSPTTELAAERLPKGDPIRELPMSKARCEGHSSWAACNEPSVALAPDGRPRCAGHAPPEIALALYRQSFDLLAAVTEALPVRGWSLSSGWRGAEARVGEEVFAALRRALAPDAPVQRTTRKVDGESPVTTDTVSIAYRGLSVALICRRPATEEEAANLRWVGVECIEWPVPAGEAASAADGLARAEPAS